jgi:hypothetical protein
LKKSGAVLVTVTFISVGIEMNLNSYNIEFTAQKTFFFKTPTSNIINFLSIV